MARRPIFLPAPESPRLVLEKSIEFSWHPGFAPSQKKKNVQALQGAAKNFGYYPLLECSTKSDVDLGKTLSAFSLKVETPSGSKITLESAFQGSKVFEAGGPYTDIYNMESRDAKRDERLRNSGRLIGFNFEGLEFPIIPQTAFYDWLFVNALYLQKDSLSKLESYVAFSDIEFNPQKSINCQARSVALFVALNKCNLLKESIESSARFIEIRSMDMFPNSTDSDDKQGRLF